MSPPTTSPTTRALDGSAAPRVSVPLAGRPGARAASLPAPVPLVGADAPLADHVQVWLGAQWRAAGLQQLLDLALHRGDLGQHVPQDRHVSDRKSVV